MRQFSCGDVVPGCTKVFTAPSDAVLLDEVADHAARDHGMTSVPRSLLDSVLAATHTV